MVYIEDCPLPAELPFIPQKECNFTLDQINRLVFVRLSAALNGLSTPFPTLGALATKASWDLLLAGVGNNKGVLSPPIANLVIPQSEARYYGGNSNETVNGMAYFLGHDTVTVTGEIHNTPPEIGYLLEKISQEANGAFGFPRVGIFALTALGQIAYREVPGTPATIAAIPVFNVNVSSPGTAGYKAPTINNLGMHFFPDWAKNVKLVTPEFDIMSLINPSPQP